MVLIYGFVLAFHISLVREDFMAFIPPVQSLKLVEFAPAHHGPMPFYDILFSETAL